MVQADRSAREQLQQLARTYLDMADRLLHPSSARLIAIGGLSGTGKSTLARAVAPFIGPVAGAITLRSDEIRKRLCGVSPLMRLGSDAYTPEMSQRVYAAIADRARAILRARHAVIADAVFAREADRQAIEQVAVSCGVPFLGVWLDAPPSVLSRRVDRRGADASDADAAVVRMQLTQQTGAVTWHRIDASGALEDVVAATRRLLD